MTTKQMADAAGVSTDTVARKIKELFPQLVESRKKTVLNQGQALKVMSEIRKVNFVQPQTASELPQTASDSRMDRLEGMLEKLLLVVGNMAIATVQPNKIELPAPKLAPRDELRIIVNKAAQTSGDYSGAWKTLYTEIYYRLHINATERAKNAKTAAIDILEAEGLLEDAVLIAREIFK